VNRAIERAGRSEVKAGSREKEGRGELKEKKVEKGRIGWLRKEELNRNPFAEKALQVIAKKIGMEKAQEKNRKKEKGKVTALGESIQATKSQVRNEEHVG